LYPSFIKDFSINK